MDPRSIRLSRVPTDVPSSTNRENVLAVDGTARLRALGVHDVSIATTNLRLVDDHEENHREVIRRRAAALKEIALENRLAAGTVELDPESPYLSLASRVQNRLQGCILSPESRASIIDDAHRLGIREFDAHLVMAVMQDRARRDEPMDDIAGVLGVLSHGERRTSSSNSVWILGGASLGLAIGLATLAIRWLTQ